MGMEGIICSLSTSFVAVLRLHDGDVDLEQTTNCDSSCAFRARLAVAVHMQTATFVVQDDIRVAHVLRGIYSGRTKSTEIHFREAVANFKHNEY